MKDTGNLSVTVIKHACRQNWDGEADILLTFFFYIHVRWALKIRETVFCWITLNPCSLNKIKPPTLLHIQTVRIMRIFSEVRGLVITQTDPNLIKISPSILALGLF